MKTKVCILIALLLFSLLLIACGGNPSAGNGEGGGDGECAHKFQIQRTEHATCEDEGHLYYACRLCGFEKVVPIEAKGHDWEDTVTEPTCEAGGYTTHTCARCDESYTDQETDPTDHVYAVVSLTVGEGEVEQEGVVACKWCDRTETRTVTSEDLGIPVISLVGSLDGITKENLNTLRFTFDWGDEDFTCYATFKLQGATSISYVKRNYNVKLYSTITLNEKYKINPFGWGKEYKYCLKANYVDFSHARNIVSARLWGQMAATRDGVHSILADTANYGAIDGYPVVIYLNGVYHGLYTFNVPKDNWMFDMNDESAREAILMAEQATPATLLNRKMTAVWADGWELEHCSTADTSWIVPSFNRMVTFLMDNKNNRTAIRSRLDDYVDVDAAIDSMLFTFLVHGSDNCGKNILWATYDGEVWIPSVYDLDATWGLYWNGSKFLEPGTVHPATSDMPLLWELLLKYYPDEVKDRYFEMRETVFSEENVRAAFGEYLSSIPAAVREAELKKWSTLPGTTRDPYSQIVDFAEKQFSLLDSYFENL